MSGLQIRAGDGLPVFIIFIMIDGDKSSINPTKNVTILFYS
ncbi:hypothetical protein AO382_0107 [Moraxella catarrhalis]|uniref:Uncharacterized protein n=1 Tax=Moraxella catarrhalis TaxID=480 RepID=A0A7Z1A4I0_MORCA|nr:hypothetical protein AO382_0107 [Moraxella catarrhalis]